MDAKEHQLHGYATRNCLSVILRIQTRQTRPATLSGQLREALTHDRSDTQSQAQNQSSTYQSIIWESVRQIFWYPILDIWNSTKLVGMYSPQPKFLLTTRA